MPKTQKRRLLFRTTKKDLKIETFRSGGPGGQHQNKRDSGVRITHIESGAVGESRSERSQHQNRRLAFERMANSDKFRLWVRIKAAQVMAGGKTIEERIDEQMQPQNLSIETRDPESGQWIKLQD